MPPASRPDSEGTMRIDFEQSGGFANITFGFHAEVDELSQEDTEELRDLVAASGILKGGLPEPKAGGSGLSYLLRLSEGPRIASWTGTDTTMPEALAPLIDRLSELAVQAAKERR